MSVNQILTSSNTELPWKSLTVYSVDSQSITSGAITSTGNFSTTGTVSGTNITPYTHVCHVTGVGVLQNSAGSFTVTSEQISTGYYRVTFGETLSRYPFSCQLTAYELNGTYTAKLAYITLLTQAKLEYKILDASMAVTNGNCFIRIDA